MGERGCCLVHCSWLVVCVCEFSTGLLRDTVAFGLSECGGYLKER